MVGVKQSTKISKYVLVSSCGARDPMARVMVFSTTFSAKYGIVWISTFPLPVPFRAPGHTLSITMDMLSMQGQVPVRISAAPLHNNPIIK